MMGIPRCGIDRQKSQVERRASLLRYAQNARRIAFAIASLGPPAIYYSEAHQSTPMAEAKEMKIMHASETQRLAPNGDLGEVRMKSTLMPNPIGDVFRGEGTQSTRGAPCVHPHEGVYRDPKLAGDQSNLHAGMSCGSLSNGS
jgi:hypothetical protein